MKAMLVIDKPRTCGGCPCLAVHEKGFDCQAKWKMVEDPDHIPDWCPLIPVKAIREDGIEIESNSDHRC